MNKKKNLEEKVAAMGNEKEELNSELKVRKKRYQRERCEKTDINGKKIVMRPHMYIYLKVRIIVIILIVYI